MWKVPEANRWTVRDLEKTTGVCVGGWRGVVSAGDE